jgi:hypothetical protein
MNSENSTLFTLYVSKQDRTPAVSNLVEALGHGCFCPFSLVIHDVEDERQLAEEEHITSTPTLVCECHGTRTTLVGDLSAISGMREFLHQGH